LIAREVQKKKKSPTATLTTTNPICTPTD
jgi:hypothetical protein